MTAQTTSRGIDIKLFGALFLLVGLIDVLIIEFFPAYAFETVRRHDHRSVGLCNKLHSPAVHFLIGYGFLFLRPWGRGAWPWRMGFGLTSELMNQFHPGSISYARASWPPALFLCYVAWRRIRLPILFLRRSGWRPPLPRFPYEGSGLVASRSPAP